MLTDDKRGVRDLLASLPPGPFEVTEGSVIVSRAPWPMEDGPSWQDWPIKGTDEFARFVAETRTDDAEGARFARLIVAALNALPGLLAPPQTEETRGSAGE